MRADLHMHSIWSDGDFTPTALVERAVRKGYGAAVLTDHDSIQGVAEFTACARANGLLTTTGVELTAYDGQEIHVLAYGVDLSEGSAFRNVLRYYENAREERFSTMRARLADCGLPITDEEIRAAAPGSVSRLHLARILYRRGDVPTQKDAYLQYLYKGRPAFAEYAVKPATEVVREIKESGGIAVLAHPARMKWTEEQVEALVKSLVDEGLDGIECFYATHTTQEVQRFSAMADRYGLLKTLGSDYHCDGDALHGDTFVYDELPDETARALFGKR